VAVLLTGFALAAVAHDAGDPPTGEEIAFAQRTSDLMVATLVAALFQEFDETTPENVEEGIQSIQLIFNDRNRDMRLVGTQEPLGGHGNRPKGSFEAAALGHALSGQPHTRVERVDDTWYYRRSVPLNNSLHAACALCHTNFPAAQEDRWVGALMLRVPIGDGEGD
jgi:hypothetical protein